LEWYNKGAVYTHTHTHILK